MADQKVTIHDRKLVLRKLMLEQVDAILQMMKAIEKTCPDAPTARNDTGGGIVYPEAEAKRQWRHYNQELLHALQTYMTFDKGSA